MFVNFTDQKGRSIKIKIEDARIEAYVDDCNIAVFEYDIIDLPDYNSYHELYSMNVDKEYQRAGIGTEIIRLGEKHYKDVVYPKDDGVSENHLSAEGTKLINSCIRKGIIVIHDEDE